MKAKRDKEVTFKKEILQMFGERDESIRQALTQLDQKAGQGFGAMELKLAVIFETLRSMGITEENLQELATKLQAQAQQAQQGQPGGETHGHNETEPKASIESTTEQKTVCEEGGAEHFG